MGTWRTARNLSFRRLIGAGFDWILLERFDEEMKGEVMESRTKVATVPNNAKKRTAIYSRSTSAKRKEEEAVGEAVESRTERMRRSRRQNTASK
jgi:hypothetical protein